MLKKIPIEPIEMVLGTTVIPFASFEDEKGGKFHFHNTGTCLLLLVPSGAFEPDTIGFPRIRYTTQFNYEFKHKVALEMCEIERKRSTATVIHTWS